jgi:hypothetical protein
VEYNKICKVLQNKYWTNSTRLVQQVSVSAFRDLDSLFTLREDAALQSWLNSKYAVHVMRDHPAHGMSMLAGKARYG